MERVEDYHQKTNQVLHAIAEKVKGSGIWAPICVNHVYSQGGNFYSAGFEVPEKSGFTVSDVVRRWINNEDDSMKHVHIDTGKWPENTACSGKAINLKWV